MGAAGAGFFVRYGGELLAVLVLVSCCACIPALRRRLLRLRSLGAVVGMCAAVAWGLPGMVTGRSVAPEKIHTVLEAAKLRLSHQVSSPFEPAPGRADIHAAIYDASFEYNVDPDLISAVIAVESSYDPQAISRSGACGLMQLMPDTYFWLSSGNPFDFRENVRVGTRYLAWLLDRFDGNRTRALAAYNVGPGTVQRHGRGIPQGAQEYVAKVNRELRALRTR